MKKVKVDLGERSYTIRIGSGIFSKLPEIISSFKHPGPVVILTDNVVKARTGKITQPVLRRIPNEVLTVTVPAREKAKSISVYQDTVQKISRRTKAHRPLIVAIGGGVVGDLAGFIAATYRRGVPFVQVPTTLLAQVDSSVGGKVGIDLPEAKNLVGAFYQPKAVLVDTDFLKTLPVRQVRNGMAEVIKYGIISSYSLFELLEARMQDIVSLKSASLEKVIAECVAIKARVVEKDEYDRKDVRIALNFGHTLGHAIETASGYSNRYNHGESIAIGMIMASEIAAKLDMLSEDNFKRIKNLIKKAGLPVQAEKVSRKEIVRAHRYDKKFVKGGNRFVLPRRIGKVEVVEDIPDLLIRTAIRKHVS